MLHKNGDGDEVIRFQRRDQLDITDPRYEASRHPRRRHARGIAFNDTVKRAAGKHG